METKEVLIAARKLIENPENWTQGEYARPLQDGDPDTRRWCSPLDPYARCFCSIGALAKAANIAPSGVEYYEFEPYELLKAVMADKVDLFNDSHTHAEVLEKFDEAIALCEETA